MGTGGSQRRLVGLEFAKSLVRYCARVLQTERASRVGAPCQEVQQEVEVSVLLCVGSVFAPSKQKISNLNEIIVEIVRSDVIDESYCSSQGLIVLHN